MTASDLADVWRREAPHVLAALLRKYGDLGDCEEALQDAAEAATTQWPQDGLPDNPRAWLITVAARRLIDQARSETSRVRRERLDAARHHQDVDGPLAYDRDDTLRLFFLCCHPALTRPSQVALSLRSVGGLSVEQIAAAYLVPARTMTQRLTRARALLRQAGATFDMPSDNDLPDRVSAVLDVGHLIFTEGYARTSGEHLQDVRLTEEAIRLVRQLHDALPEHAEVAGALALMLLTQARSAARTDEAGDLIPLAGQDRTRWRRDLITEGVSLLEKTLPRGHIGRFQLQAAIAAVHAEATTYAETDWLQISLLYDMLTRVAPSPAVTLNHAVAVAMAHSPEAALAMLKPLSDDPAMSRHHRLYAVRAHLLELKGDPGAAREQYRMAARLTASGPEQRYLNAKLSSFVSAPATTSAPPAGIPGTPDQR
ncbi:RNA polymerase sigma factor [Actinoplanes sp. CA-015351]|uniref:RNA polymerase sigma factor n=1 Tax=Actinoplanes sp. CA-015351 TaxID=3239897 RepID=UPI003D986794